MNGFYWMRRAREMSSLRVKAHSYLCVGGDSLLSTIICLSVCIVRKLKIFFVQEMNVKKDIQLFSVCVRCSTSRTRLNAEIVKIFTCNFVYYF